jgi:two-component sensor histidine kinase/CheY-like chemotaxis protein
MEQVTQHDISLLFVEDNETIRFLYNRLLSKRVKIFYIAEDGKQGLELYQQHKPDLIITDISMPIMDGLEMIKLIKEIDTEIKVIVMSAYSIKEYFLEAINLGVNGYLIKPVEAKKLYQLIDDLASQILLKKELENREQQRRQAEESLKRSLAEKDILLKEVHHRVKNNMQIISSILKMQERQVDDPKLKEVLEESQNRIRSMALVHEDLYRNENLENIKFINYAKSLAGNLMRTFSDHHGKINMVYEIEDVLLPLDTGIPCGLIINELISNSFKYAFKNRESGIIKIGLKSSDDGKYLLEVSDDGVGFDKEVVVENAKTLGLKIVNKLVQQIEGTLEYDFSEGSKFIIRF